MTIARVESRGSIATVVVEDAMKTPPTTWRRYGNANFGKFERELTRQEFLAAIQGTPPSDVVATYGLSQIVNDRKFDSLTIPKTQSQLGIQAAWAENRVKVSAGLQTAHNTWLNITPSKISNPQLGYFIADGTFHGFDPETCLTFARIAQVFGFAEDPISVSLRDWGHMEKEIEGSDLLVDRLFSNETAVAALRHCLEHETNQVGPGFIGELREYQSKAFQWLSFCHNHSLGGILALDMGLGKTCTTIALIENKAAMGPSLIVCPLSLMWNWHRELSIFAPRLRVDTHQGQARSLLRQNSADVIITTYETLKADIEILSRRSWNVLVLDEAQRIKNPSTSTAIACRRVPSRCSIALTGTPMENSPLDLWSITDMVFPGALGTQHEFEHGLANRIMSGDDRASEQLREQTAVFMFRKIKEDVLDDLPPLTEKEMPLEMNGDEKRLYNRALDARSGSGADLGLITCLMQQCAHPTIKGHLLSQDVRASSAKYDALCDLLSKISDANEKAILFTQWLGVLDLMCSDLPSRLGLPVFRIDGGVSREERSGILEEFNSSEGTSLLVGNYKTLGEGHNITSANHVIHYGGWWNPAVIDQATDRTHRIGQELPVFAYHLYYKDSIDTVLRKRVTDKRDLAESILYEDLEHTDDFDNILASVFSARPQENRQ